MAARKLNRPVRLLYDRATDTLMVGKRHPYLGEYHIAFTRDGILEGMRLDLHSDAGDTYDCSFAVMDLSLLQSDGCYMAKTFQANGTVYRTNKPSNTAFRTFGKVQPYVIREDAIEHVAHQLSQTLGRKVLPEEIRRKNLYRTGTHEGVSTTPITARTALLQHSRDLGRACTSRRTSRSASEAVEEFNRANRWRKRGIAMIPQKYGIAFTEPRGSLNASSALVNVNMADGSVVVQHGGVEMGQGLNTKIAQLAANTLGIPLELDSRRRQQQRRDRQRPGHGRFDRLRSERRRRRQGLPGPAHPTGGFLPRPGAVHPARLHRALAVRLGGQVAGDRLQGLVQPRQSERRRAVQEPALRGAERAAPARPALPVLRLLGRGDRGGDRRPDRRVHHPPRRPPLRRRQVAQPGHRHRPARGRLRPGRRLRRRPRRSSTTRRVPW